MRNLLLRGAVLVIGILAIQACSSVGCGLVGAPIPGGYPPAEALPNALQLRITQPGFADVSAGLCGVFNTNVVDIVVPPQTSGGFVLCPTGTCTLHLDCNSGSVTPVAPNGLDARIVVQGSSRFNGVSGGWPVTYSGVTCNLDVHTVPHTLDIPLTVLANTHDFRRGFAHVVPGTATLDPLTTTEFSLSGSLACSLASSFIGGVASAATAAVSAQLNDSIRSAVNTAQCQRPDAVLGCPGGTTSSGTPVTFPSACTPYCEYAADPSCGCAQVYPDGGTCPGPVDDCVPLLVGPELQGDFGEILARGGTQGAFGQIISAGYGDGHVVDNGMSLFFAGGLRATDENFVVPPSYHHACVAPVFPTHVPVIPAVDAIGNAIGTSTHVPDLGMAFSEDALGYFMYGVYNSGALCLDFEGTQIPQLRTGILSVISSQLGALIRPAVAAPLRFALRPTTVPSIHFSSDSSMPHMVVGLQQLQVDVEVFDSERYVRIFTYIADLTLPLDVEAGTTNFHFTGEPISVAHSFVGNTEILGPSVTGLQSALDAAAPVIASLLEGLLPDITLPTYAGIGGVPIASVVTRDLGTATAPARFLTVYGTIQAGLPLTAIADTTLEAHLVDPVDPRAADLETFAAATTPELVLVMDSPGASDVELSYRIDGGPWSIWSTDHDAIVSSRLLLLQARHVIEARARHAGEPASVDPTPARVELIVDMQPPALERSAVADGFEIRATDLITPPDALRHRVVGAPAWSAGPPVGTFATGSVVEVIDEAGNVSTLGSASRSIALLTPDITPRAASGSCSVGARSSAAFWWPLLAGVAALLWRRRAR